MLLNVLLLLAALLVEKSYGFTYGASTTRYRPSQLMATEEDMKQKLQEALELESDALVRRIVDTESTENRQKLAKV